MKRILWESKITKFKGKGCPLPDKDADEIVKELNMDYPELHHWTERVVVLASLCELKENLKDMRFIEGW